MTNLTVNELKKVTQSHKRRKNFPLMWGYTLHRNVSVYITYLLLRRFPRISANAISVTMVVLGVGGSVLVYFQGVYRIIGVIVVYLSFLLDKVDGEIARFRGTQSMRGLYLDELYHAIVPSFFAVMLFLPAVKGGTLGVIGIVLLPWLLLLQRYNRKISLMAIVKAGRERLRKVKAVKKKTVLSRILQHNILLRATAVVERFDVLIFLGVVIVVAAPFGFQPTRYIFYIYFAFALVYVLRWMYLNYDFNFLKEVHRLTDKMYD